MPNINDPKQWKNIFTEVEQEKDVEIKSQGKVNVARGNRLKALDPEWRKSIKIANEKKVKDPTWRKKVKDANNNWSKERTEAYQNRDKSYLKEGSSYRKNLAKRNHKSRIPVEVKKPGKDWVRYESVREFAATTIDPNLFESNPRYYFPKDMSIKTIKHNMSPYVGWQFRRLIEEQARDRKS